MDLGTNEKQLTARCELDHVNSQAQYPLYQSSIWNLVPVCHDCNRSKLDQVISFNSWTIDIKNEPFQIELSFTPEMEVGTYLKILKYKNILELKINISSQDDLGNSDLVTLRLNELYMSRLECKLLDFILGHIFDGIRSSTKFKLEELKKNTSRDTGKEVFSYYFAISIDIFESKHYSKMLYSKLISEFIRQYISVDYFLDK